MKTKSRGSSDLLVLFRPEFLHGMILPLAEGFKYSNDPGEYIYLRSLHR